jgi:recombinational DNA repair protein RecR
MNNFYNVTYELVEQTLKKNKLASCKNCTHIITEEVVSLCNKTEGSTQLQEVVDHIINIKLIKKELCI